MIPKMSVLWLIWLPVAVVCAWLLRRKKVSWGQVTVALILATYSVWIASVAFVPGGGWMKAPEWAGKLSVNLVPFRTIADTLRIYWR